LVGTTLLADSMLAFRSSSSRTTSRRPLVADSVRARLRAVFPSCKQGRKNRECAQVRWNHESGGRTQAVDCAHSCQDLPHECPETVTGHSRHCWRRRLPLNQAAASTRSSLCRLGSSWQLRGGGSSPSARVRREAIRAHPATAAEVPESQD
jgi:hypothetical protein